MAIQNQAQAIYSPMLENVLSLILENAIFNPTSFLNYCGTHCRFCLIYNS